MKVPRLLLAALLVLPSRQRAQAADIASVLAITNVTVVDTAGGPNRPGRTVVVRGDRIAELVETGRAAIPPAARRIDGTGKFLIPGLWDMHTHAFFGDWVPGGREVTLPLFLANGVTGVRDMGSDLDPILAARRDIESGKLVGPRMIVSGPMLDGPKSQFPSAIALATPEDGRRAVATLAGRGVDFIKIQSYVKRDVYLAVAEECRRRGVVFAGHVPDAVRAAETCDAGQKSWEHLIGVFEASSTAEERFLDGQKGPARFLETFDRGKEAALLRLLAKKPTWQCPTLFWERGQWLVDVVDVTKDPNLRYAPASWRTKTWPEFAKGILKDLATDPLPTRERFVRHELEIVGRMRAAGVPFLAGTDTPAGVGVLPGFSLHQELERFVEAGFSPLEALQTATRNPAVFLGKAGDFGAVEAGRVADLVLLDADPGSDIRNTHRIAAVVANGRLFSRADLDRLLADAAAYANEH
jgi:imidazolonepropionase-like amidohydrolase